MLKLCRNSHDHPATITDGLGGSFSGCGSTPFVLFSEDGPVMVVLVNRGISPSFSIPLRYQYVGSEVGVLMS